MSNQRESIKDLLLESYKALNPTSRTSLGLPDMATASLTQYQVETEVQNAFYELNEKVTDGTASDEEKALRDQIFENINQIDSLKTEIREQGGDPSMFALDQPLFNEEMTGLSMQEYDPLGRDRSLYGSTQSLVDTHSSKSNLAAANSRAIASGKDAKSAGTAAAVKDPKITKDAAGAASIRGA